MTIPLETVHDTARLLQEIYNSIALDGIDDHHVLGAYTSSGISFGLDENAYNEHYRKLFPLIFSIPNVSKLWSVDAVQEKLLSLLKDLAVQKSSSLAPDYQLIAQAWLESFNVSFQTRKIYLPIHGLTVSKSITIKDVTFLPLDSVKEVLTNSFHELFLKDLDPFRNSIAIVEIDAEDKKAAEIAFEKAEYCLNILRYFGSLVWYNQPPKHIYVSGREPKIATYVLTQVASVGESLMPLSNMSPVPFAVADEFLTYAEFYGFSDTLALANSLTPSEIVRSFLLAIQWYGDGLQDLTEIFAFTKFYITIETALKRDSENAKKAIPRRLSVLLETYDKNKQASLEGDIEELIDERNAVFHSGEPKNKTMEYLAFFSRIMARQCLLHLQRQIKKENWVSKDDIVTWVSNKYDQFLKP